MNTKLSTSLIVPMFNESHYIEKLLNSIYTSSHQVDEILLCDNNSTDNTMEVAKKFNKILPINILHQKEKGILPTVDLAWRQASGNIILKVDADCIVPIDWVHNTLNYFIDDPLLMACSGPVIGCDGNPIDRLLMKYGSILGSPLLSTLNHYPLLLGPNTAFRKSSLVIVNGYASNNPDLDDQLISRKLFKAGLKTRWFTDMKMYHSTRRYQHKPLEYLKSILSIFNQKFYSVKTN